MKKAFTYSAIILLAIGVLANSASSQPVQTGHPGAKRRISESFAVDTVLQLPEVRTADAYVRRATKGKRHLFSMVYGEPDKEHPYYWVAVGEDNGMSFVTHFGFQVYINGGEILYLDNDTGNAIDLMTWRRNHHRKRS